MYHKFHLTKNADLDLVRAAMAWDQAEFMGDNAGTDDDDPYGYDFHFTPVPTDLGRTEEDILLNKPTEAPAFAYPVFWISDNEPNGFGFQVVWGCRFEANEWTFYGEDV